MITVQLDDMEYSNFTAISVMLNVESVSGEFSFAATAGEGDLFPLRVGAKIKILVDGTIVMTGYIERLFLEYGVDGHVIEASGRNILCDLIDSTVGTENEFEGEVSIIDIARALLDDIGLEDVRIINRAGEIESFSAFDIESAEVGEKCFDFIEKLARKRQFFWNSDGEGNLVLLRTSPDAQTEFPGRLICRVGDLENNILKATLEVDHTDRYSAYYAEGNLNITPATTASPEELSEQSGEVAYDSEIRSSRVMQFDAEENANIETATSRAVWESNIRIVRSMTYTAIVQGHSMAGSIWSVNVLVDVDDQIARIKEQLFVKELTYQQSIGTGSTTELSLTYRNAFALEQEAKTRAEAAEEDEEDEEEQGYIY